MFLREKSKVSNQPQVSTLQNRKWLPMIDTPQEQEAKNRNQWTQAGAVAQQVRKLDVRADDLNPQPLEPKLWREPTPEAWLSSDLCTSTMATPNTHTYKINIKDNERRGKGLMQQLSSIQTDQGVYQ